MISSVKSIPNVRSQGPGDVFTQAFAFQFISLILFILIFSLAAFLKEDMFFKESAAESSKAVQIDERQAPHGIGAVTLLSMSLPVLDSASSINQLRSGFGPVAELLKRHDLVARVELTFASDDELETSVALAQAISQMAENSGIPSHQFNVSLKYSDNPSVASLTIERTYEN